jgi:hypothetical protein
VALIEEVTKKMTGGNKTEAVALAMRRLLEQGARATTLFGAHKGSVRIAEGVDLTAPSLDVVPDAETAGKWSDDDSGPPARYPHRVVARQWQRMPYGIRIGN